MATTLKCVACNIVIDELLAYVQNKLSVMDEESLKRICVSAFNSDEITKSKTLLLESLPSDRRKIVRKRKGKKVEGDLDDIISVLKSVDPDKIPIFVARDLERLPPILFDHLDCTKLLKDLSKLNAELEEVKNTYATSKQIEELWSCMHNLKHASLPPSLSPAACVNMRRGGGNVWNIDSGPIGLPASHNISTDKVISHQSQNYVRSIVPDAPPATTCHNNDVKVWAPLSRPIMSMRNDSGMTAVAPVTLPHAAPESVLEPVAEVASSFERGNNRVQVSPVPPVTGGSTSSQTTAPAPVQEQGRDETLDHISRQPPNASALLRYENENNNSWQNVNKRKRKPRYRYLGERGRAEASSVSSFKAADKKVPIFITNVHVDTVESDIADYIEAKTQVKVSLEKINMKKVSDHKAFKFLVPETKMTLLLDDTIWPEGIIFRRFVHYKNRRADTAGGTLPNKYG